MSTRKLPEQIETERLLLRKPHMDDAPVIFNIADLLAPGIMQRHKSGKPV
jgi:hypothetical protein